MFLPTALHAHAFSSTFLLFLLHLFSIFLLPQKSIWKKSNIDNEQSKNPEEYEIIWASCIPSSASFFSSILDLLIFLELSILTLAWILLYAHTAARIFPVSNHGIKGRGNQNTELWHILYINHVNTSTDSIVISSVTINWTFI